MPGAYGFGSNIPESTHKKNRVDPFYGYGQLDQSGMAGLMGGEQAGTALLGQGVGNMAQSLAMYNAMAAGQGPSLAEKLAQQKTASDIATQQAMMAQGRGGAAAGQQRAAALAGQGLQAQSTANVAGIRAQEQLAAMGGAAQLGTAMAGLGGQQQLGYAGMLNQAQIAQMNTAAQFELQQRALQQQERMGRFQRHFGWANLGRQWIGDVVNGVEGGMTGGAMSDERMKHDVVPAGIEGVRYPTLDQRDMGPRYGATAHLTPEDAAFEKADMMSTRQADPHGFIEPMSAAPLAWRPQNQGPLPMPEGLHPIQSGGTGGNYDPTGEMMDVKPAVKGPVGGGSTSDRRAKHEIQPAGGGAVSEASALAGSMNPVEFEYNTGSGPPGRRVGIIAQDLERTPVGRNLVIDTPQGKQIDTPQATNAALAMIADQEQRLRQLEGGGPRRLSLLDNARPGSVLASASPGDYGRQIQMIPEARKQMRQSSALAQRARILALTPEQHAQEYQMYLDRQRAQLIEDEKQRRFLHEKARSSMPIRPERPATYDPNEFEDIRGTGAGIRPMARKRAA